MSIKQRFIIRSLLIVGALLTSVKTYSNVDFSGDYERIYQIRVVSPDAGSKSSIGSGFQVSADGIIMTNYRMMVKRVFWSYWTSMLLVI